MREPRVHIEHDPLGVDKAGVAEAVVEARSAAHLSGGARDARRHHVGEERDRRARAAPERMRAQIAAPSADVTHLGQFEPARRALAVATVRARTPTRCIPRAAAWPGIAGICASIGPVRAHARRAHRGEHDAVVGGRGHPQLRRALPVREHLDVAVDAGTEVGAPRVLHGRPQRIAFGLGFHRGHHDGDPGTAEQLAVVACQRSRQLERPAAAAVCVRGRATQDRNRPASRQHARRSTSTSEARGSPRSRCGR